MIYIGNFRNIQDDLYTVEFRTEVESEKSAFSPHSVTTDDKITFSLNRKGEYVFALPDLDYVDLYEYSSDIQILQQDGAIFTVIAHEDNQTITFKGDENYFDMINITQYNTKFITLAFEEPVTVNYTGDDSDIYKCAKYSNMIVRVINDKLYDDLFSIRSNDVRATLYKDGNIEWQGYLTPNVYSQDYAYSKNELELECVDSLAVMQYEPYKEKGNEVINVYNFRKILDYCLNERFDRVYYPLEYKSGKIEEKGELPNGYTRLGYIRTDGKAYIDININDGRFDSLLGKLGIGIEGSFRVDSEYVSLSLGDFPSVYLYGFGTDKTRFMGGVYLRQENDQSHIGLISHLGWCGYDYLRRYENSRVRQVPPHHRSRPEYDSADIDTLIRTTNWDENMHTVYNTGKDVYYSRTRLFKESPGVFRTIKVIPDDMMDYGEDSILILGKQGLGTYNGTFYYALKYVSGKTFREVNSEIDDNGANASKFRIFGTNFSDNNGSDGFHSGKPTTNTDCEYFRMYNWGELVYNFIPCMRQSDGEVGLFETETQTFYSNTANEGSFIAGDVIEEESVSKLSEENFDNYINLENLSVSEKTWYKETNKIWEQKRTVFENIMSYLGLTAIAKGRNLYLIDYEHINIDSQYLTLDNHLHSTNETANLYDLHEFEGSADDNTTISIASPYSEIKLGVNTDDYSNVTEKLFKTAKELIPKKIYTDSFESTKDGKTYTTIWEESVLKSKFCNSYIWSPDGMGVLVPQTSDSYFLAFNKLDPSINPQEVVGDNEAIGYIAKNNKIEYQNNTDFSHVSKGLDRSPDENIIHIIPSKDRSANNAELVKISVTKNDLVIPSNAFIVINFNINFSTRKECASTLGEDAPNQFQASSSAFTVPLIIKYGDKYYTENGWKDGEDPLNEGIVLPKFFNIPLSVSTPNNDVFDTEYSVVNNINYDMNIDSEGYKIPLFVGETDTNNPEDLTVSFIDFANPGYDGNANKLAKSYIISNLSIEILPSLKEDKTDYDDEDNEDYIEVIDRSYVESYNISDFKIYSYNNKKAAYNTVYAYIDGNLYLLNSVYDEDLGITGNFEEFAIRKRIIQYSCPRKKLSQSLFGLFNPWTKFRNEKIYGDINFIIDGETIDYRTGITTLNLVEKR